MLYFYAIVAAACTTVVFRRSGFDALGLMVASAILYFIPGLFGFGFFVMAEIPYVSIFIPETYACMAAVLATLVVTTLLYDTARSSKKAIEKRWGFEGDRFIVEISILFSTIGLIATFLSIGVDALIEQKREFIDELGYSFWAFEIFASLATVVAYAQRRFRLMLGGVALLLVDLLLGFRLGPVTTVLSILLLAGLQDQRSLASQWRLLVVLAVSLIAALVWKELIAGLKDGLLTGDFTTLRSIVSSPERYADAFFRSEPFVTATILNEVVRNHYQIPASQLLGLFAIAVPFTGSLDASSATFGSLFQRDLFPEVTFGLAHNIWGQMHAIGGFEAVVLYAAIFSCVAIGIQELLRRSRGSLAAFIALSASYWVFYSHRNDLFYQLLLQRRIVAAFLVALVCSVVLMLILSTRSAGAQPERT